MLDNPHVAPVAQNNKPALSDLVAKARTACAGINNAHTNATQNAVIAGDTFNLMDETGLVGRGEWSKIAAQCGVLPRQIRRYRQLADLAKRSSKTALDGLSIEAAIRKLKGDKPPPPKTGIPVNKTTAKRSTHVDVLATWIALPPDKPEERTKTIDAIGLKPLIDAMPAAWLPLAEQYIAARRASQAPVAAGANPPIPEDLCIPSFLHWRPVTSPDGVTVKVADSREGAGAKSLAHGCGCVGCLA